MPAKKRPSLHTGQTIVDAGAGSRPYHQSLQSFQNFIYETTQSFRTKFSDNKIPEGFEKFFPKSQRGKAPESGKTSRSTKESAEGQKGEVAEESTARSNTGGGGKNGGGGDKGGTNGKGGANNGGGGEGKGPGWTPPHPDGSTPQLQGSAVLLGLYIVYQYYKGAKPPETDWMKVKQTLLRDGKVDHFEVNGREVHVYEKLPPGEGAVERKAIGFFTIGSAETFERKLEQAQREMGVETRDFLPVVYKSEMLWNFMMSAGPPIVSMGLLFFFLRRMGSPPGAGGRGSLFDIGKAKATVIKGEKDVRVTFKDVAGLFEAKQEVVEFVDFLKNPKKYTDLGAKVPKGAMLVGPPGTGKTLMAKAVAGEASVPFFSISGSDFIEMFVGIGPSRVRDLFKQARENAPCIVFIDEIDAVGRKRGRGGFGGGNDERENTLNQLLVEMDGFEERTGILVLAGTNRADVLDEALLRPGRFDRQITIDKPDLKGREEIFQIHLAPLTTLNKDHEQLSGWLAKLTPGFAGAEIMNVCNEAALIAARIGKETVENKDFEAAIERIVGGIEKRNRVISTEEKEMVAYHEAGHAVVGWMLKHCNDVLKVSIIPRGQGLGYTQHQPKEQFIRTKDQIFHDMCMTLGGRAAEYLQFGSISTGAADDLKRVTKIAYAQVKIYGFSKSVGPVSFQQGGQGQRNPYSEAVAEKIDQEARQLVHEAYTSALAILEKNKESLEAVAKHLLEKEVISQDELRSLIGERPHHALDIPNPLTQS